MTRIDKLEKLARALLWLSLAVSAIFVARGHASKLQHDTRAQTALRTAEQKLAAASAQAKKPVRLGLDSLRPVMSGLVAGQATGKLWFTNVSPRAGIVCVRGHAVNEKTNRSVKSLAACAPVAAYASVTMELRFAGRELDPICPDANACRLAVEEAPEPSVPPSK